MLLPKPHKVKNDDIFYQSGARQYLKQMEKKKAAEPDIFRIEGELSQFSLYDAQTIQELDESQQIHEEYADVLRQFCYSKQQSKRRRSYEIQKEKCFNKICTTERKFALDVPPLKVPVQERLLMFVGNSGLAIGSRVKGFRRYGGY